MLEVVSLCVDELKRGAGEVLQNKEKVLFLFAGSLSVLWLSPPVYIPVELWHKAANGVMSIFRDKLLRENTMCLLEPLLTPLVQQTQSGNRIVLTFSYNVGNWRKRCKIGWLETQQQTAFRCCLFSWECKLKLWGKVGLKVPKYDWSSHQW